MRCFGSSLVDYIYKYKVFLDWIYEKNGGVNSTLIFFWQNLWVILLANGRKVESSEETIDQQVHIKKNFKNKKIKKKKKKKEFGFKDMQRQKDIELLLPNFWPVAYSFNHCFY